MSDSQSAADTYSTPEEDETRSRTVETEEEEEEEEEEREETPVEAYPEIPYPKLVQTFRAVMKNIKITTDTLFHGHRTGMGIRKKKEASPATRTQLVAEMLMELQACLDAVREIYLQNRPPVHQVLVPNEWHMIRQRLTLLERAHVITRGKLIQEQPKELQGLTEPSLIWLASQFLECILIFLLPVIQENGRDDHENWVRNYVAERYAAPRIGRFEIHPMDWGVAQICGVANDLAAQRREMSYGEEAREKRRWLLTACPTLFCLVGEPIQSRLDMERFVEALDTSSARVKFVFATHMESTLWPFDIYHLLDEAFPERAYPHEWVTRELAWRFLRNNVGMVGLAQIRELVIKKHAPYDLLLPGERERWATLRGKTIDTVTPKSILEATDPRAELLNTLTDSLNIRNTLDQLQGNFSSVTYRHLLEWAAEAVQAPGCAEMGTLPIPTVPTGVKPITEEDLRKGHGQYKPYFRTAAETFLLEVTIALMIPICPEWKDKVIKYENDGPMLLTETWNRRNHPKAKAMIPVPKMVRFFNRYMVIDGAHRFACEDACQAFVQWLMIMPPKVYGYDLGQIKAKVLKERK